jgi:Fe-S cluster assembly ATPase SufC
VTRIAILGNAGSGKSTLARSLAGEDIVVLDLDTIAWVSAYFTCGGSMSFSGHRAIFDRYDGPKRELSALPCG